MIELSECVFDMLRKDEEFVLYRGQGKDVASRILVLSPARQRPLPDSLKRLENEYSLREELDPSSAVQPIGIATHWDRMVLVLADPGGVPLDYLLRSAPDAYAQTHTGAQQLDIT